ncbi:hypothetical protein D7V78_09870 [Parabacteroides distasonis]|uniref:Uncharacterized protein n=1 Tax=Parabacteroides distasonis TaxID=823 RepID=A0A3L7ZU44_PARDI|nr:hypothetical protein [Parabacteroides distasonis]RLT73560.1 hypothetical protein D7V78_09870 [Parabacteroides distasonis]TGY55526.1 hypothetical protein E5342_14340 [Parabacteroides distasonis]
MFFVILLFNLDSINKELVTKIARKSYRISHLVAFLNLIMCVFLNKVCVLSICTLDGARARL